MNGYIHSIIIPESWQETFELFQMLLNGKKTSDNLHKMLFLT